MVPGQNGREAKKAQVGGHHKGLNPPEAKKAKKAVFDGLAKSGLSDREVQKGPCRPWKGLFCGGFPTGAILGQPAP